MEVVSNKTIQFNGEMWYLNSYFLKRNLSAFQIFKFYKTKLKYFGN